MFPVALRTAFFAAITAPLWAAAPAPSAIHAPTVHKNLSDPAARALALLLKPLGLTDKADPTGLGRVQAQEAKILDAMELSQTKGGPGAEELLNRAYSFVPEVGSTQRAAAVAALGGAWRQARALGLFDLNHHFTDIISIGDDAGKKVTFEYIVPPSQPQAHEFSQDVTNVRLVAPSFARNTPDSVTGRDLAYLTTLQAVSREVEGRKKMAAIENGGDRNAVGQTTEVAEHIWKEEMDREGEAAKELPHILVEGQVLSTPSRHNGDAWHIMATIKNISQHATEVDLEATIIGATWKKHEDFVMLQKSQKIHLRSSEVQKIEFVTLSEAVYKARSDDYEQLNPKTERPKSHAYYRGVIFRVNHAKGQAAIAETTDGLAKLFDADAPKSVNTLPKFYLDTKVVPPPAKTATPAKAAAVKKP